MITILIIMFTAILAGCSITPENADYKIPTASTGESSPLLLRSVVEQVPVSQPAIYDLSALLLMVEESPAMEALKENIARDTGAVLQGGYMPNPVLNLEVEMMPIDDMGFGSSKNMVMIKQRFETAGKARARVDVALAAREESLAQYFHERRQLLQEISLIYSKVIFTIKKSESAKRMIELKEELLVKAKGLKDSGRIAQRDLIAYKVAVQKSHAELAKYKGEERKLLRELEGHLCISSGSIKGVEGDLSDNWIPDDAKEIQTKILSRNSELILLDRKLEKAVANLKLQEGAAYPDVTLGIGYARGIRDGKHDDFLGAVAQIPFPLIDRNQGGKRSAEASIRNVEAEMKAVAYRLLDGWHERQERWNTAKEQGELYYNEIIPLLEEDLKLIKIQVDGGRLPVQSQLKAALDLEDAVFTALGMDESMALTMVEMVYLLGEVM